MTKRILTAALALCAALPIMAQSGPGGHGGQGMPGGPGMSGGPGGGRGNRVDFLAGYLNLTDAQKSAAKAIFDAAESPAQTVFGQMTSAHDSLRQAIKDGKPDTELDTLSESIGTLQGQATAIQAKAQSKFYALLTAEQKTKYDERSNHLGIGMHGMQGREPGGR